MYIVVGLGNPGNEYARTRHNAGFDVIDVIGEKQNIRLTKNAMHGLIGEGFAGGEKLVLVKPQTFMNLSGESVVPLAQWYKPRANCLALVYDDCDLPVGALRVRPSGSPGTHNGMKSVIGLLGREDFPRVRVGIGHPDGQRNLVSHVLGAPDAEEKELLLAAMNSAADAVELIVHGELREAQARFNKRPKKEKPKAEPAEEPLVLMPANKAGQGEANE